jgi:hypothetical protein
MLTMNSSRHREEDPDREETERPPYGAAEVPLTVMTPARSVGCCRRSSQDIRTRTKPRSHSQEPKWPSGKADFRSPHGEHGALERASGAAFR